MNCGLSSKLVGTGFAVHRSVLEASGGWNSVTIAEDAEFAAYLAQTGTRVWFVPEAVTYDEAPTSVLVSLRQRRRWSSGVMDVAQVRGGALLESVFTNGGMRAMDMLLMLLQPYCQTVSFLLAGLLLAARPQGQQMLALATGAVVGYVVMTLFAALLSILQGGQLRLTVILLFPLFMASWLPLNLLSLLFRTRTWQEIEHGKTSLPVLKNQVWQQTEP